MFINSLCVRFLTLLVVGLAGSHTAADIINTYQIGNSLTVTATPSGALANWAAWSNGDQVRSGMHISCGNPLAHIFANPQDTCVSPPFRGRWETALNQYSDWDHIVFQPHVGNEITASTLGSDVAAINSWIATAQAAGNSQATFYVMQGYPGRDFFQDDWYQSVDNLDSTPTIHSREYYDYLMQRVIAANPDAQIYMIPVAETFALIDQALAANPLLVNGELLSSIADFYRDDVHGNQYGGLASGAAIFASLFETGTWDLTTSNSGFKYGAESLWSEELYQLIHGSIYQAHQQSAYARNLAIPEPASAAWLLAATILLSCRRRRTG